MNGSRAGLIGGLIMVAVGITRIVIGVYVPLGILLIVLGLLAMLLPLWRDRGGT